MQGKKFTVFDVGGTKARGALIRLTASGSEIEKTLDFRLKDFLNFEEILTVWFKENDETEELFVGVAGPVDQRQETLLTNINLLISKKNIEAKFKFLLVTLVNDMTLQCYGVLHAQPEKILQECDLIEGNKAVLALGTGLGQGYLTYQNRKYAAHASEGGHATFAPETDLDWQFAKFLRQKFSHVSWERVVSGKEGFNHIHEFFLAQNKIPSTHYLYNLDSVHSKAQEIVKLAVEKDPISISIVEYMLELLAREAGNCALKIMARGGVYLTGGVMCHLSLFFNDEYSQKFVTAFSSKNRFKDLLQTIPIYIVTDPLVALRGSHHLI